MKSDGLGMQVRRTYSARTCAYIRRLASRAATFERWLTVIFTRYIGTTSWIYSRCIRSLLRISPATYKSHSNLETSVFLVVVA